MSSDLHPPLIFQRAREGQLIISRNALGTILTYRQLVSSSHEAGGVLLGRYSVGSEDIVIESATTPQARDKSSRHRFHRAKQPHQKLIDGAWEKSGGVTTYLGEWHTHPEEVPTPSAIDRVGWTKKSIIDHFSEAIFFLIVGTTTVRVWEGARRHPAQYLIGEHLI